MKNQTIAILGIIGIIAGSISGIAYGSLTSNTITIDNSDRREYTWCPISDQLAKTNIEIEGCPLTRVYVNDWNKLTVLEQTQIDTELRSLGFVDSGEHIIK